MQKQLLCSVFTLIAYGFFSCIFRFRDPGRCFVNKSSKTYFSVFQRWTDLPKVMIFFFFLALTSQSIKFREIKIRIIRCQVRKQIVKTYSNDGRRRHRRHSCYQLPAIGFIAFNVAITVNHFSRVSPNTSLAFSRLAQPVTLT